MYIALSLSPYIYICTHTNGAARLERAQAALNGHRIIRLLLATASQMLRGEANGRLMLAARLLCA